MGFPGGSAVESLPANAGAARDAGIVPGSGRSSGEGNGNSLQYSMDRGSQQAISPWGCKESDTTGCACARAHTHTHTHTTYGQMQTTSAHSHYLKVGYRTVYSVDGCLSKGCTPVITSFSFF